MNRLNKGSVLLMVIGFINLLILITLSLEKYLIKTNYLLKSYKHLSKNYYEQKKQLLFIESNLVNDNKFKINGQKVLYHDLEMNLCKGKYYQIKLPLQGNLCLIEHFAFIINHDNNEQCIEVENDFWGRKSLTIGGCV